MSVPTCDRHGMVLSKDPRHPVAWQDGAVAVVAVTPLNERSSCRLGHEKRERKPEAFEEVREGGRERGGESKRAREGEGEGAGGREGGREGGGERERERTRDRESEREIEGRGEMRVQYTNQGLQEADSLRTLGHQLKPRGRLEAAPTMPHEQKLGTPMAHTWSSRGCWGRQWRRQATSAGLSCCRQRTLTWQTPTGRLPRSSQRGDAAARQRP